VKPYARRNNSSRAAQKSKKVGKINTLRPFLEPERALAIYGGYE